MNADWIYHRNHHCVGRFRLQQTSGSNEINNIIHRNRTGMRRQRNKRINICSYRVINSRLGWEEWFCRAHESETCRRHDAERRRITSCCENKKDWILKTLCSSVVRNNRYGYYGQGLEPRGRFRRNLARETSLFDPPSVDHRRLSRNSDTRCYSVLHISEQSLINNF